ncbi:MAG: PilX N-terminal domain-containing pilus assembly protein [Gemmatimonadota bacterium]
MQHTPGTRQGGFTLLVVLIGLVGLAAVATVGVIVSDTDNKMSQNEHSYQSAFYAADAGLTDFLVANDTAVSASGSYSYSYGTAAVSATSLMDVNDLARLYRVTSVGTYTAPDGSTSTRTLSRIVMFHAGGNNLVAVPGAVTALAGFGTLQGGADSASLTGVNSADSMTCSTSDADIAGVSVPDSMYTQNTPDTIPTGDPPVDDTYETGEELGEDLNLDWAGIQAGTVTPFDHTVNVVKSGWPDFSGYGPTDWPVTFVDLTSAQASKRKLGTNESGRGLMIVTGDITVNADFQWDGVIMVGGSIDVSGQPVINGVMLTGLDILTGDTTVVASSLGNGQPEINFNSCYAQQAFESLGQYPPSVGDIPKTWLEAM